MRITVSILILLAIVACGGGPGGDPPAARDNQPTGAEPSSLWGRSGELWRADGRLPDFSHAGYGGGAAIPEIAVAADVARFGAVGDGVTDDSEAFLAALDSMPAGALWIPPGRYLLTRVLELESGQVLRGAGSQETTLYFPKSLLDIRGFGPFGGPRGWAWGGGWIWAQGETPEEPPLAEVVEPAKRGDRSLTLSSTAGIAAGQLVRLTQQETTGSLTLHLHNQNPLDGRCWVDRPGFRVVDWAFRVAGVEGRRVHLDRPLRVDVETRWSPRILPFHPTVSEVGVEGLALEFPLTEYPGHHNEPGLNGIYFHGVHNSWIRDVSVENFDTAISVWLSRYVTATGLLLRGRGGHYGLNMGASQDSLMTDFTIDTTSLHDLSVSGLANGNVFSNGSGRDINFDHHRGAPYENLFSNIDVGESWRRGRLWDSSGTPSGHYTAARETFWNIRPRISTKWIPAWPQMNIIGPVRDKERLTDTLDDLWLEKRKRLKPADLHAAQVARRLAGAGGSETR